MNIYKCNFCFKKKNTKINIEKHYNICKYKPIFLDKYYNETILKKSKECIKNCIFFKEQNELIEKYNFIEYIICNVEKTEKSIFYKTYGNILNIKHYNNKNLLLIEYNIIFSEYNGNINILIDNIKLKTEINEIIILNNILKNKKIICELWNIIKTNFIQSNWLFILYKILYNIKTLSYDDIENINYIYWLRNIINETMWI